ncbi:cellulose binding domain-containing protein [Glycomyces xiaoerkulensis]|uniref:cellulose binding domain-containing protein n=1 Tax=Glycomyces xiaoerkulensis TaxID=2038139 RepID=UPI000C259F60|nr:cellulose binding domain-containing protein [Glycomyces xiaoerkulensis]
MRLTRTLLRLVTAGTAALIATAAFTAPASAAHPERPPQEFAADQTGEDLCTDFHTSGEVAFPAYHPPEEPSAAFRGETAVGTAAGPCVPRENHPRRVEFTAYSGDDPVASRTVPAEPGGRYEFDLVSASGIDHVTVAVCIDPDAESVEDRCGEAAVIGPGGTPEPESEPSYCEYSLEVVNDWGTGWQAVVAFTPLVEDAVDWEVIISGPGIAVQTVWNAEMTVVGDTVYLRPAPWSGVIPVGATFTVGFVGSGDFPPAEVEVYVNGRPCDPAA